MPVKIEFGHFLQAVPDPITKKPIDTGFSGISQNHFPTFEKAPSFAIIEWVLAIPANDRRDRVLKHYISTGSALSKRGFRITWKRSRRDSQCRKRSSA